MKNYSQDTTQGSLSSLPRSVTIHASFLRKTIRCAMATLYPVSLMPCFRISPRFCRVRRVSQVNCFDRIALPTFCTCVCAEAVRRFAGTVVDEGACHPHNYDFFLVSQAGLIVICYNPSFTLTVCIILLPINWRSFPADCILRVFYCLRMCIWLECRVHLALLIITCL